MILTTITAVELKNFLVYIENCRVQTLLVLVVICIYSSISSGHMPLARDQVKRRLSSQPKNKSYVNSSVLLFVRMTEI